MTDSPSVIRTGDFVFVSGIVAIDAAGKMAPPDVKTQTRMVIDKLREALAGVGASMGDVVKHSIYFTCAAEQGAIDAALSFARAS